MNIRDFRALTPDAKIEALFSEHDLLRKEIATIHTEIAHFRELEDERKRLRRKRAKAARLAEVGDAAVE